MVKVANKCFEFMLYNSHQTSSVPYSFLSKTTGSRLIPKVFLSFNMILPPFECLAVLF